jgi:hypothetical protein
VGCMAVLLSTDTNRHLYYCSIYTTTALLFLQESLAISLLYKTPVSMGFTVLPSTFFLKKIIIFLCNQPDVLLFTP